MEIRIRVKYETIEELSPYKKMSGRELFLCANVVIYIKVLSTLNEVIYIKVLSTLL